MCNDKLKNLDVCTCKLQLWAYIEVVLQTFLYTWVERDSMEQFFFALGHNMAADSTVRKPFDQKSHVVTKIYTRHTKIHVSLFKCTQRIQSDLYI